MSLANTAHADLIEIIHGYDFDDVTVTSPAGATETIKSITNDIFQSVDPGTGQIVSGRVCTVSLLISDLIACGFSELRGVVDSTSRPWVVQTTDVNGRAYKFKVSETHPDNGAGLVLCYLEAYQ
jgi:hypothetical protein